MPARPPRTGWPTPPGSPRRRAPRDRWRTLGLRVEGERFEASLDGRTLFSATDRTFAEAGRIGLCTKADSVTRFDGFEVARLR